LGINSNVLRERIAIGTSRFESKLGVLAGPMQVVADRAVDKDNAGQCVLCNNDGCVRPYHGGFFGGQVVHIARG
jgi:hypothetical protein